MIFNPFEWHIKNDRQFDWLAPIMSFLHLWRMPLLFLISGMGTYFAMGKRDLRTYLRERSLRLLLPLIAGIFILVPVQVYIERIGQYESLLSYYGHMFEGTYPEGNFSWHHLWFIAYLWLISVIITPILRVLEHRGSPGYLRGIKKVMLKPLGMNAVLLPLVTSQILLKPYFPEETHDVVNDWAFLTYNAIFFISGFTLFIRPAVQLTITRYRRLYLAQAVVVSFVWFLLPATGSGIHWWHMLLSAAVAWSCGVTALGYAARYLNRDSRIRKKANEAIYPFYLLHQPLIILSAYLILREEMAPWSKALLIAGTTLTAGGMIYWFIIRPFHITRLIFGMKSRRAARQKAAGDLDKKQKKAYKSLTGGEQSYALQTLISPEDDKWDVIVPEAPHQIRTQR